MSISTFSRRSLYLMIIALYTTFSSCKKDDERPDPECQLIETIFFSGAVATYEYGNTGLLKKYRAYMQPGDLRQEFEFEYNSQRMLIKKRLFQWDYQGNPYYPFVIDYQYDTQGRWVKTILTNVENLITRTDSAIYLEDKIIIRTKGLRFIDKEEVQEYSDGNLVKSSIHNFKDNTDAVTTYTYYLDKVDRKPIVLQNEVLLKSKNLLKQSVKVDSSLTFPEDKFDYSYEFDQDENLIAEMVLNDTPIWHYTNKTTYKYKCQ